MVHRQQQIIEDYFDWLDVHIQQVPALMIKVSATRRVTTTPSGRQTDVNLRGMLRSVMRELHASYMPELEEGVYTGRHVSVDIRKTDGARVYVVRRL